jgi:hypothetical protein
MTGESEPKADDISHDALRALQVLTEEEQQQFGDAVDRLFAIMRELNGKRSLQAFLVADLLSGLVANGEEERRQWMLEQVVAWARNMVTITDPSREAAWRQQRQ